MLLPLIITASSLPLIAFLGYYNLQYKSKQIETDEFILFKETIQSVLKYTVFGVERKYCFGEDWDYNLYCSQLTYDRSSERILFSNIELGLLETFIEDQVALGEHPGCTAEDKKCYQDGLKDCRKCLDLPERLADIKLNTFEKVFQHADLKDSKKFILADYFEKYTGDNNNNDGIELTKLTITVSDKAETYEPQGKEKYIQVKVQSKIKDRGKSRTYTITWDMALFPREMNNFSLVLARDLYFYDKTGLSTQEENTDETEGACIVDPSSSTIIKDVANSADYKGLTFQSPVFVNGNLHFKKDSNKFTPIHFIDKLFLGKGELKDDGKAFTPSKAGALFDYKEFNVGGFYKGILLEDSDKGLDVFSGQGEEKCKDDRDALEGCLAQVDGDEELEYSVNYTVENVSKVSLGGSHTCGIQGGKVYCWGHFGDGRLGDGTGRVVAIRDHPSLVKNGTETTDAFQNHNVSKVFIGYKHSCAIKTGKLYCWGYNDGGRLGDGSAGNKNIPTKVSDGTGTETDPFQNQNVEQVSLGDNHTCAIQADKVYCWGRNYHGQLGDGTKNRDNHPNPIKVKNGTGDDPFQNENVKQVSSGRSHTCAIQADKVYCWGRNTEGQLGNGESGKDWILNDGGGRTSRDREEEFPIKVKNGTGDDAFQNEKIEQISSGSSHTCAIQGDNRRLYCWGWNDKGQLGTGSLGPTSTPALVENAGSFTNQNVEQVSSGGSNTYKGDTHTCAIQAGKLYCWGKNEDGQLGDGTNDKRLVPTKVSDVEDGFQNQNVSKVLLGHKHTCAIQAGKLYCWGKNDDNQLGRGSDVGDKKKPRRVNFPSIKNYLFAAGSGYNCFSISYEDENQDEGALVVKKLNTNNNSCWGLNDKSQLGDGTRTNRKVIDTTKDFLKDEEEGLDLEDLQVNSNHSCAIQAGKVYCWGYGNQGQLGNGSTKWYNPAPIKVSDGTEETNPFKNENVEQISLGGFHSCAIQGEERRVYCWGYNSGGELGDGTNARKKRPTKVSNGTGDDAFQNENVEQISVGSFYSCAIQGDNRRLYCWGDNSGDQLGRGSSPGDLTKPKLVSDGTGANRFINNNIEQVSLGHNHTCAIQAGKLYCWGYNYGEESIRSGIGGTENIPTLVENAGSFTNENVEQISLGSSHTCAIKAAKVYCWGHNDNGQLGDGTTTAATNTPTKVADGEDGFENNNVEQVFAGHNHTCAIKDGKVYCWGANHNGQLAREEPAQSLEALEIKLAGICTAKTGNLVSSLDWFMDLSPYTRTSWNFTEVRQDPPVNPKDRTFDLDRINATKNGSNFEFHVKALFGKCNVTASADFVAGFFACDKFTIEERTTPLRIIGTVITSQLDIHEKALKHGVNWSNIWHPQALYDLREVEILNKDGEEPPTYSEGAPLPSKCDNNKNYLGNPIHPQNRQESLNCNPSSLREGVDPFLWTSVDPDCAIIDPENPQNSCKFYIRKFVSHPILRNEEVN